MDISVLAAVKAAGNLTIWSRWLSAATSRMVDEILGRQVSLSCRWLSGSRFYSALLRSASCAALTATLCSPAAAQTWTGNGGDGDWSDAANWDVAPVSDPATALVFGTNGNGFDPTNDVPGFTLNAITLNDGFDQTITGESLFFTGTDPLITMNANSDLTIENDFEFLDNGGGFQGLFVTGTGTGTLTLSGVISSDPDPGEGNFNVQGGRTFAFSGTNTYTGVTRILQNTTLIAANDFALGDATTGTTIDNGSTLALQGSINLQEQAITLRGSGVGGNGALRNLSGDNTVLGAITLATATRIQSDADTLSLSGGISGTQNLTFGGAGATDVSGIIGTGTGSVTLDGTGTTTFSGVNTYSGGTFLNGGVLSVSADNNFGDAAGALTFDGGTLQNTAAFTSARDVTLNAGGGTFQTNADLTLSTDIAGTGALTKTGSEMLTLTGDSTYTGTTTVDNGTLTVDGSIASPTTVNNGGTLMGTGTLGPVTVLGGGIHAPGNSIGTQTVNGDFTLAPGAIFEVEVNAAGQSDRVVVNGTVELTDSILRVLAEGGSYNPETDYLIIDNDNTDAVVGEFGQVTTNFAFLTPEVLYDAGDGNDVVLTLLRAAEPNFCSVATTANQCNVAQALEQFPDNNPLLLAILGQTNEGARQAFNALSGEIHATMAGVLVDESRYVREAILGRLMQASHSSTDNRALVALGASGPLQIASRDSQTMASGYAGKPVAVPASTSGREPVFWMRGFGAWAEFDGNRNAASADRDFGGFISGVDTQISPTWRAGLAAGFTHSDIDVDARLSSADVDSYHLAAYTGGALGRFALRGGGSWTWHDVETSRAITFPGFFERASADYDADMGQLFGEVAYPMAIGAAAVEPFAGLAYVHFDADGSREQGGTAALTGRSNEEGVGYFTLGARAAATMQVRGKSVTPHVSLAWQHAFDDTTPDIALAFASTGAGFGIRGVPLAEDSALIDAGLDVALSPNASLGVSWTSQLSNEIDDYGVKGRFTWRF